MNQREWQPRRLKHVAQITMGQSPDSDDCNTDGNGLPFLQGSADFGPSHPEPTAYCPCPPKRAPAHAILLSVRAPVGELNIASTAVGLGRGICAVVAHADGDQRFFYYALHYAARSLCAVATGSTYDAVSANDVGNVILLCPLLHTQRAIADFLDRETAKIDDLIAKKDCLLDRLEEYRFSLIARSVSQGLPNLDVRWKQARLGRVFRLQRGFDITEASHGSGSVPVISSGGFSGVTERPMVKGPGVVVGRKGTLGTVHYVERDYWPHDTTLFVQDFRGSVPRFVYYFLRYLRLESYDVGAANPTLNRNHVHPLPVRWPDYRSQRAIADHLDQAMPQIDAAAQTVKAAISLLREYRAALISAAVTGQIDIPRHDHPLGALA